jgi:DNA-directed RNA polymerase specialized sigma24 family protein
MSKRDYVREELADIESQVADKNPDAIGEDVSDLAAIGLARYDPRITPDQLAKLVVVARSHGRSWEEIGSRLGMSAEDARKTHEHRSRGRLRAAVAGGSLAAAVLALRHLLRSLGGVPRA